MLSTSVAARSAVAVGVPTVPFATPPASITVPVTVPVITAASLRPWIVIVIVCSVPSAVCTVNVSVSESPALRAWTSVFVLSSV